MKHFLGQPALHNEQNSLPSKILLNQSINKPINTYNLFKKKTKLKPELEIYLSGYKNAMSSHHRHPAPASQTWYSTRGEGSRIGNSKSSSATE